MAKAVFNSQMWLRSILRAGAENAMHRLDDAIMPLRCVFCGTRSIAGEGRICTGCRADLPWIENACARCAEPVASPLPRGVTCASCQQHPPPFTATIAPLRYEFPVDAALKALKFGRRLYYAPAFAELLESAVHWRFLHVDALLPVPLHWRRQALRGFNQATELCRPLAKSQALPVMSSVARCRATPFQSGLVAKDRQKNLHGAFRVRKTIAALHVLIVDDVVTTGATTRQLSKALLDRGATRVSVLAVAKAV